MKIHHNYSLKSFNTFGIDVKALQFVTVEKLEDFKSVVQKNTLPLLILGGGSNVLFTKDFEGLVVLNQLKGIEKVKENNEFVLIKAKAGEIWHDFVLYCIKNKYAGIENLSLIPGTVGAAPMQNIGAYGVEVKDLIVEVEALSLKDFSIQTFKGSDCQFGYRTSIFKTTEKGNYFIISVTFKLNKKTSLNTSYGAIDEELNKMKITSPTIKDVSDAVISIRTSKLPNPKEIGNSGSFFKNPIVSENVKDEILKKYPEAPTYVQLNGDYKIAAGWLIEQCGWKGKTIDNFGVHKNQALVLVNYGGAKGNDIFRLSEDIIYSVKEKFSIVLEREVNII